MSDYPTGSVLDFKFNTILDDAYTTLAGTPAVSVYKDNNTTQTTTGVTLTVDFDGHTGCHNVRVDTSDSFYAAGSSFQVVVTAGTVGGNSIVGHVVDEFTLGRSAAYGRIGAAGAGLTALGDTRLANLDATVSSRMATFALPANFSLLGINASGHVSRVVLADTLTTYTGNTPQTGDSFARIGAAGAGLTALGDARIGNLDATVSSRMATFTLPSNFAALSINGSGHIARVVLTDALTTNNDKTGYSITGDAATAGTRILTMIELDGSVYRLTTNALEQAPTGGGSAPTAEQVAAEVDEVLTAAHGPGSWAVGGSGAGAYAATVTVTDGTTGLQNATVRVREGLNTYTGTTDASGDVSFSLDAATYTVTVTKDGYSFTPTTRTVTGNQAGTLVSADLVMTAVVIPAAADPAVCVIYGTLIKPDGTGAEGMKVTFHLDDTDPIASSGNVVAGRTVVSTETDEDGAFTANVLRGYTYKIRSSETKLQGDSITIASGDSTKAFSSVVS